MTSSESRDPLHQLASLCGIDLTYHDIWGETRTASPEALTKVLQALGVALDAPDHAADALRLQRRLAADQLIEPVQVAWDGRPAPIELQTPSSGSDASLRCVLETETGERHEWSTAVGDLPLTRAEEIDGVRYEIRELQLIGPLSMGYHRLTLHLGERSESTLIISAPTRAWTRDEGAASRKRWGLFMPLHALGPRGSTRGGSLGDLERLMSWTAAQGGSLVGALPMLAAFLDEPFNPSPYSPASRLFWNELFLDLHQLPDLAQSESATNAMTADAPPLAPAADGIDRVDYRAWASFQRSVLEPLSESFFARGGERDSDYQAFLRRHPRVTDYAAFRAVAEQQRTGWVVWPESLRDSRIGEADGDPARVRYHCFVQWRLDQQLTALGDRARQAGAELYLDFPLGVNPDSYDTWRERDSFAANISVGAPPDMFFTGGQSWGFPPLHPWAIRRHGYQYLIESIRNHTRHAGALRIDHVMGLARLFWIPQGMGAQDGVYVRSRADELYAILALESHRARCLVIGEDLGTVPDSVREAMTEHDLLRMYVAQFEMRENPEQALNVPPVSSMASVNTHDTVLFGGFWEGLDIEIMRALDLIDDDDQESRRTGRRQLMHALCEFLRQEKLVSGEDSAELALQGLLRHLSASQAEIVMVTLEDLWLERQPQNVPGTGDDWGNWRRKARYTVDEIISNPKIMEQLREINSLRQLGVRVV